MTPINYYMARVRGGVGLGYGGNGLAGARRTASAARAWHLRRSVPAWPHPPRFEEIHRGGGKCSIQLGHGGGHTRFDICGETPVAPSAIPHPVYEVINQTIVPGR